MPPIFPSPPFPSFPLPLPLHLISPEPGQLDSGHNDQAPEFFSRYMHFLIFAGHCPMLSTYFKPCGKNAVNFKAIYLLIKAVFFISFRLYWGYVHCEKEGQVRVDEEFLLLSADLVHEFITKKEYLLCNPFGDISVAMWVNNVNHVTYFNDKRIYHEAGLAKSSLIEDSSLCHSYLALNSAYKKDTLLYWSNVQSEPSTNFEIPRIPPFEKTCNLTKHVDWKSFAMGHRFEPVRCMRRPVWNSLGKMYFGKQGAKAIDKNALDPIGDEPVIPP